MLYFVIYDINISLVKEVFMAAFFHSHVSKKIVVVLLAIFCFSPNVFAVDSLHGTKKKSALNYMPAVGIMIGTSAEANLPILQGIKVNPDEPFKVEFVLDTTDITDAYLLKQETGKLINYFLAALTIPEKDLWVNLSPYEKDRIISNELGITELGRDMLGEDYVLKQLASSLTHPDSDTGKHYWDYLAKTNTKPSDTLAKVWIVPQRATIYQDNNKALITDSYLEVMTAADYTNRTEENNALTKLLPEIEREVNKGENFARLRQIYHSLLLATWYKNKLKNSLINKIYSNKKMTKGVDLSDPSIKDKIYQQYVSSFLKGTYSYVKKERNTETKIMQKRKYFSGGKDFSNISNVIQWENWNDDVFVETSKSSRFSRVSAMFDLVENKTNDLVSSALLDENYIKEKDEKIKKEAAENLLYTGYEDIRKNKRRILAFGVEMGVFTKKDNAMIKRELRNLEYINWNEYSRVLNISLEHRIFDKTDKDFITSFINKISSVKDFELDDWSFFAYCIENGILTVQDKDLIKRILMDLISQNKFASIYKILLAGIEMSIFDKNEKELIHSLIYQNDGISLKKNVIIVEILQLSIDKGILSYDGKKEDIEELLNDLVNGEYWSMISEITNIAIKSGIFNKDDRDKIDKLLSALLKNRARSRWAYYYDILNTAIEFSILSKEEKNDDIKEAKDKAFAGECYSAYLKLLSLELGEAGKVHIRKLIIKEIDRVDELTKSFDFLKYALNKGILSKEDKDVVKFYYTNFDRLYEGYNVLGFAYESGFFDMAYLRSLIEDILKNIKPIINLLEKIESLNQSEILRPDQRIDFNSNLHNLLEGIAVLYSISPRLAKEIIYNDLQRKYLPLLLDHLTTYANIDNEYVGLLGKFMRKNANSFLYKPREFLALAGYIKAYEQIGLSIDLFAKDFDEILISKSMNAMGQRIMYRIAEQMNISINSQQNGDFSQIHQQWDLANLGLLMSTKSQWREYESQYFNLIFKTTLLGDFENLISSAKDNGLDIDNYNYAEQKVINRIRLHNNNAISLMKKNGINIDLWRNAKNVIPTILEGSGRKRTKTDILNDFVESFENFKKFFESWELKDKYETSMSKALKFMGPWSNLKSTDDLSKKTRILNSKNNLKKIFKLLKIIQEDSSLGDDAEKVFDLQLVINEIQADLGKENIVQGTKLQVRFWERQPGKDSFLGNRAGSCTSLGVNANAIFEFLLDVGTMYAVVENQLGEANGYARFFVALDVNNKPALFIDSVDGVSANAYQDEIYEYIADFAESIGISRENVFERNDQRLDSKIGDALTSNYFHHSVLDIEESFVLESDWDDSINEIGPTDSSSSSVGGIDLDLSVSKIDIEGVSKDLQIDDARNYSFQIPEKFIGLYVKKIIIEELSLSNNVFD